MKNQPYNLYKRDGHHYCRAVPNGYTWVTPDKDLYNYWFPELTFIHSSPETLPDKAVIDGEDLESPYLNRWPCVDAISFKNPEQMYCIDDVFMRKEQKSIEK